MHTELYRWSILVNYRWLDHIVMSCSVVSFTGWQMVATITKCCIIDV